jgi:RHS repeat-associated protein
MFATNDLGLTVWEASYLPFGGIDLRFPGQWFQSEAGLHQNWMRDYDPTTGRYLQADPLGLVDGASVYGYALQNPGRYVDPRGEESLGGDGSINIPIPLPPQMPWEDYPGQTGKQTAEFASRMVEAIIAWCFPDECGPHNYDGARAIAERNSGILALKASGAECTVDASGEASCACPGRMNLRAMIRHDWADDDFAGTPGAEHHKCPHWHWRNCSGAKGVVVHR